MLTGLMPHLSKRNSESGFIHSSAITHTTLNRGSALAPVTCRIIKGHCEITAAFVQRSLLFTARIKQQKQINSSESRRMFVKQRCSSNTHDTLISHETPACVTETTAVKASSHSNLMKTSLIFYPKSQKKEIRNQRK